MRSSSDITANYFNHKGHEGTQRIAESGNRDIGSSEKQNACREGRREADEMWLWLGQQFVIHKKIGVLRLGTQLAQKRHDLAAVVARVIDHVKHLLPERVGEGLALAIDVGQRVCESLRRESLQELVEVMLDRVAAPAQRFDGREVGGRQHLAGRASEPAFQPNPFSAENVGQRIPHRAKAVAHRAGELFGGKWLHGRECALVSPVVIEEEFANGGGMHWVSRKY